MNKETIEVWIDMLVPGCCLLAAGLFLFVIATVIVYVAAAIFKL